MAKRLVKKSGSKKKLVIWIVSIVAVLGIIGGGVAYYINDVLGTLQREELNEQNLDIYDDPSDIMWQYHNDVKNFALFGIDARDLSWQSRSDVMIIISVNYSNNTIRLVSLQRDLYVKVRGSNTKLSHAYFYGGAELALSSINRNFEMNLDDFVTVNFYGVEDFVDYLGGITLEITEEEMHAINRNIDEQWELGMDGHYVKSYGRVKLNGSQAVGFARVRDIDSDFARGERQRKVIMATLERIKELGLTDIDGILRAGTSVCSTSLTNSELVHMATWALTNINDITFESESLPGTLCSYGFQTIDNLSYVTCNMNTAINALKNFLYDEDNENVPVPVAREDVDETPDTDGDSEESGE